MRMTLHFMNLCAMFVLKHWTFCFVELILIEVFSQLMVDDMMLSVQNAQHAQQPGQ